MVIICSNTFFSPFSWKSCAVYTILPLFMMLELFDYYIFFSDLLVGKWGEAKWTKLLKFKGWNFTVIPFKDLISWWAWTVLWVPKFGRVHCCKLMKKLICWLHWMLPCLFRYVSCIFLILSYWNFITPIAIKGISISKMYCPLGNSCWIRICLSWSIILLSVLLLLWYWFDLLFFICSLASLILKTDPYWIYFSLSHIFLQFQSWVC